MSSGEAAFSTTSNSQQLFQQNHVEVVIKALLSRTPTFKPMPNNGAFFNIKNHQFNLHQLLSQRFFFTPTINSHQLSPSSPLKKTKNFTVDSILNLNNCGDISQQDGKTSPAKFQPERSNSSSRHKKCSPDDQKKSQKRRRQNTGNALLQCPKCNKTFNRNWLLKGHLRTHTGEKPFQCNFCKRSFADNSNLRAHKQTHSDEKRFECGNCHRKFALKSYLSKHKESACGKYRRSVDFCKLQYNAP